MENPCYQCGAVVEEGVAFCPHCNAPQIRVSVASPEVAAPAGGVAGEVIASGPTVPPSLSSGTIQWAHALPAAGLAAFLELLVIQLGATPGIGMLLAGFLCVTFYRRRVPGASLGAWMGARLGAICGAVGAALFGILTLIELRFFHGDSKFRDLLLQQVDQAIARNPDPQARQMFQYLKTPEGLQVLLAIGVIAMFCAFVIFSSLGGAAGAAMLRRRNRR